MEILRLGEAEEPLGQKPPSGTRVGGRGPRDRPEGHTAAPVGRREGSKRSGALAEAPGPGGWTDWRLDAARTCARAQPGRRLKTCDASCAHRPHL
ncbi:hypothetical protein AB1E18_019536 [Capra hircus]